ncbi:MAG: YihY family inner membrane protein [Deltaproteobacteria bacterium]|nr:YihY family inner membrane protein [Deltaproteobacteria bacterium]
MRVKKLWQNILVFFRQTIWDFDPTEFKWPKRFSLYIARLTSIVGTKFGEDQITLRATALAYTTLLSLVPLIAVSLSIFKAFGGMEQIVVDLQRFLLKNLTTGTGEQAAEYLTLFIDRYNSTAIGLIGFLALILSVIATLSTVEKSFNHIWKTPSHRSFATRLMMYWTLITLGPLFLALSLSITAGMQSFTFMNDVIFLSGAKKWLFGKLPWLITFCLFTAMYLIMPNTKVRIRSAAIGGFIAALLWEGAKFGYTLYAAKAVVYSKIYGSFGLIPLFLIWVYYSWIVVLLGSEIAFADQHISLYKQNRIRDKK